MLDLGTPVPGNRTLVLDIGTLAPGIGAFFPGIVGIGILMPSFGTLALGISTLVLRFGIY